MTKPRKAQMSLDSTPYYYCSSSCNKKTFLSGIDEESNKNYDSRRIWIEERLKFLSTVFSIQHCALNVLAHHYHIILFIDQSKARSWSTPEVVRRWHQIFNGSPLSRKFLKDQALSDEDRTKLLDQVEIWRKRLMDISWYMRCANESIAREINKEEKSTGRFWEGRFKSKALNDETALKACLRYVAPNKQHASTLPFPNLGANKHAKSSRNKSRSERPLAQGTYNA